MASVYFSGRYRETYFGLGSGPEVGKKKCRYGPSPSLFSLPPPVPSPFPFPSVVFTSPSFLPLPLRVGLLNPARGSGGAL